MPSPRDSGIETYLREIQSIPPLEADATELFSRAAAGDAAARERILMAHLSCVVRIACKYSGYGLPLADLVAEGNLGLIRAVELFDPKYGVPFLTYSGVWIKQRIHRAITSQSRAVRIPVWRSQRLRKLDRLHEELNAELGRDSSLTDLADRIGLSQSDLDDIAADRLSVQSLDAPGDLSHAVASLPDDRAPLPIDRLSRQELLDEVMAALHDLDDTELRILGLKFGLLDDQPASYREMAPRFGRSREWIRKIGEGALAKVTAALRAASGAPRALIRSRTDCTRRRLQSLGRKKQNLLARLSLFHTALIQGMEPVFSIL